MGLTCTERNDSADRIVRGHADGDSVTRHDFDAKAPHAAAQLRQHFMAGVALNSIQAARMNGHDRSLHVDKIVLAQSALPFNARPALRAPGLATSVPHLVSTCNVMAYMNLAEFRMPAGAEYLSDLEIPDRVLDLRSQ